VVSFWSPLSAELRDVSDLFNHPQINIGGNQLIFVFRAFGYDLDSGVADIAGSIEISDIPGLFCSHSIDSRDEIAVGCGMGRRFHSVMKNDKMLSSPASGLR